MTLSIEVNYEVRRVPLADFALHVVDPLCRASEGGPFCDMPRSSRWEASRYKLAVPIGIG